MLQVSTLGNAFIAAGDLGVPPTSSRTFATLLYLASEPGRRVPRAGLQSLIFPDMTDSGGSHSLRQMVYKLRQSGAPIESKGAHVWVGADRVRRDYSDVIASDHLSGEQLASIEGGFLPGYAPEQSGAFAEWLDGYRTRTTLEIRRTVLRDLARARLAADWPTVERAARACLALDPLNEEATLALAEAIACSGSKAAAVRLLDDYLEDIGSASADLRVPATVLRRRISERMPERGYRPQMELPFVGRESEMAFLAERFQQARRGESQCVVISGEPGIGKTRLAAEFANVAALDGARIERMAAQPHDVHRPLGAFVELVPRLLQLPGALGCSPESMAALKRLTTLDPNAGNDQPRTSFDAEAVFYGITRGISDLVDAIATECSLLLMVEDGHWLDSLSVRVLRDLASVRKTRRLLVVLTSRETNTLADDARYSASHLALTGIERGVAAQLILQLTGVSGDSDRESLSAWMATVSMGNPLFIGAVTTHFLATGERFTVPPTLRALISRRLETIDRTTFAVLQMCAVQGNYCTLSRLVAALDTPALDLLQAIQTLQTGRLIVASDAKITIAHALVTDAIIEQSAGLALQLAHRKTAEVLEGERSSSPDVADLWELAEHWMAAGDHERALAAFRECARYAMDIGRPREAAIALNRALELPLSAPDRGSLARDVIHAADLACESIVALRAVSVYQELFPGIAHDATELAELQALRWRGGDSGAVIARLLSCMASPDATLSHRIRAGTIALMLAGDGTDQALPAHVRRLLTEVAHDSPDNVDVIHLLLIYEYLVGDLDESVTYANSLSAAAASLPISSAVRLKMNSSRALWGAGFVDAALAQLELAYNNAIEAGLLHNAVRASANLASRYLDLDVESTTRAELWLDRCGQIAERWPEAFQIPDYTSTLIDLALLRGRTTEAVRLYDRATSLLMVENGARRWMRVTKVKIDLISGVAVPSRLLTEQFLQSSTQPPRAEPADVEMDVVLRTLVGSGEPLRAKELADWYVRTGRLLRSPLEASLRRTYDGLNRPE